MKSSDRLGFYESLIGAFLARAREKGHIVFEVHGHSDQFVQYQVHNGRICGEVGSRQWSEPERPLTAVAVEGIGRLGFVGGGPERNYARDGLPRSAHDLAELCDALLRTAYDLDEDFSPVVRALNLNDVTPPRAEPFTRDMIAAHLRDNDIRFLRDEDGDLRVDLSGPSGEVATVWFVAEGEGEAIYRISSCAHRLPATRLAALECCNTWNREHRWPKAFVVDHEQGRRIILGADVDLEPGVPRPLFDAFTKRVAAGMVEFWSWMASHDAAAGGDGGRRRRRQPRKNDG